MRTKFRAPEYESVVRRATAARPAVPAEHLGGVARRTHRGGHLLALVRAGARFVDGVQVEPDGDRGRKEPPDHATSSTTLENTS
jgi:hypothetical protein